MKRRLIVLALVLVFGGVFLSSCQKEELSSKKEVLSFIFEASKNVELDRNIISVISGSEITANVPFGTDVTNLIPTFEVSPKAIINAVEGQSTDFSSPVSYTVSAEDGTTKTFTTLVVVASAPYIGTWSSNAIDFGLGLMRVELLIDESANMTMELPEFVSGELDGQSVKGKFEPITVENVETKLNQTHQWQSNQWREVPLERTIMYEIGANNVMRFYYCYCYPRIEWAFQVDMQKQ